MAVTSMVMGNNIATTLLHQAITSKSESNKRAAVIRTILDAAPGAATIRNGYGSLPLHVVAQRNTRMESSTKEDIIISLIKVYPEALIAVGASGKRTPLHVAFTDYISLRVSR